ncbi:structural maintenance of chromosomes protein 4, putative [Plasmodium vinckei]|uniref:Structural maintenance of chromosomes protein n=1 Tax=Plasmodium vinckei TaxID=5860 RepID=A0A6V7T5Z1_PLAVN|nr:structural maintenance of chromosomes protein 4, putative [Plasmodium vinckei]
MTNDTNLNNERAFDDEEKREEGPFAILSTQRKESTALTNDTNYSIENNNNTDLCLNNIVKKSNKRIIIEKLILENFKSYSGIKIIGPFYKKFSCIVGPNGSGKSNIIDAMLFVFGRRAKKIRQNKLSDLIHNSKYSTNNEYTKVSIYFKTIIDKPDEEGGTDDNADNDENVEIFENDESGPHDFVISREATIDNQSKYRIDGKVVTQKDVFDLLYKKGIDLSNNRFLILQGEVEQIAQMNPKGNKNEEGLLEYLEDIIGTNKYIDDINSSLENFEKSEEVYHEKVNRLKHVYNELKELACPRKEAQYYMDLQKNTYKLNIISLKKDRYEFGKIIYNKEKEHEEYVKMKDAHNSEYNKLLEDRKEINTILNDLENEEDQIIKKKNKTDSEFKKLTQSDENIKKELVTIVEKMQSLYVKREELKKKKIPLYKKTIEEKQNILTEIKKNKLPKLEQEVEKCEEELDKYNEEIKKDIDKINEVYSNEEKKLAPLQNRYDCVIKDISECITKCNIIEKKKREYRDHVENLEYIQSKILNEIKEKDIQIKHMVSMQQDKENELAKKEKDLQNLDKKIEEVNKNLVNETVAYETIKKELVTNKTTSKLHEFVYNLKKNKIKGIHGMLNDLGYIDKKYEKALLIAGNNYSDLVVVQNPNDAILLFEEVRKANLGRINVLSLSILEKNLKPIMLSNEQNYTPILPNVHRLIDFVKFKNNIYKICFYHILKETLLANTLDEAHIIGYTHKKRVVTLNGELIENDGRICGGGIGMGSSHPGMNVKSKYGPRSSIKTTEYDESDLIKIEKSIKEINKHVEQLKAERNILLSDIKSINSFIEDNECKTEIANKRSENLKKQLKDIDDQLENSQVPELTKEEESELKSLKELIEKKNNERDKIDILLKEQESKVKKYYDELQNVGGEKKKKLKSKLMTAERQLNLTKEELEKHSSEEINALADLEKGKKDILKFTEEIEEYEKNEKELEQELNNIETKGCTIYEELNNLEQELNQMQVKIEENKKKKQIVDESISKKDLENVDILYKIENIEKEIKQYLAKKDQYELKIKEYMDLIEQSDKVILENMTLSVKDDTQNDETVEGESPENETESDGDTDYSGSSEYEEESTWDDAEDEERGEQLCLTDGVDANVNDEEGKKRKRKKKKKKEEDEDEEHDLRELEDMLHDNNEINDTENEYDYLNIKDEELEVLNKKEIEAKIEHKLHICEKKAPNLKVFQDYNLKLHDYKKRRKDVKKSKKEKDKIRKVYDNLCNKRRKEFLAAFNIISYKLKEMYQMIAIGGDAELEIIDSSEIFNEGILFSVRPPKKSWKHIQNLSGGEKTLSSLALVFALHYFKPNPIYFMDEIDAALDFKNVSIISHYIKTKTSDAQFIVISLRNQMFELCDRMVGIYKTNDITKCITLNPYKIQDNKKRKGEIAQA